MILLLRMLRNTITTTFGFKTDLKFGLLVQKNIYTRETWAIELRSKGIYRRFRDLITAHVQKHHLFYFRFQNGPEIRIPRTEKHVHAWKFGLKTAF